MRNAILMDERKCGSVFRCVARRIDQPKRRGDNTMSTTYIVKSGDTLSAIALRYNVKGGYQALAQYNSISNPNSIQVGQKIVIPSGSTSGGATASASSSSASGSVQITASALNVRTGASTSYKILGTLKSGQIVGYTGEKNGWLKISYNGQVGWISKKYTKSTSAAPTQTSTGTNTSKTTTMYVTASALNVRSGAGTNHSVIGSLANGKSVSVLSQSSGWAKISYKSGTGYVSLQYLSKSKPSNTTTTFTPATGGIFNLNPDKLKKVASGALKYYSELTGSMGIAAITTKQRACCYVAQLAHESGNFYYMEEIASGSAYEGRTDLGNTQPGDGKRYKGRGPIQITGRYNYTQASKDLGIDLVNNPQLASKPEIGFKLSAWYWNKHNLNSYSDRYDFTGLTKAINGGTNGLADRRQYYEKAVQYL